MVQNPLESGRLYFAYGSNLSTAQMHSRCPLSTPIGLAHLAGWTCIINQRGYANIVPNAHEDSRADIQNISQQQDSLQASATNSPQNESKVNYTHDSSQDQLPKIVTRLGVYGLVYRLHPEDERQLDLCEGVGYAYEREMLEVVWSDPNPTQSSLSNIDGPIPDAQHETPRVKTGAPGEEEPTSPVQGKKFKALVYVDSLRVTPSIPKKEYVGRMNTGIKEAIEHWGLPTSYVDEVIRPYIPALSDGC
ncbi:hypothetical protein GGS24DRAFT_497499 [Hypoxylon argillaceum]|nr:hypothetical protein GGS24DRAFT_497499 [Hypoxylon argillaceum]